MLNLKKLFKKSRYFLLICSAQIMCLLLLLHFLLIMLNHLSVLLILYQQCYVYSCVQSILLGPECTDLNPQQIYHSQVDKEEILSARHTSERSTLWTVILSLMLIDYCISLSRSFLQSSENYWLDYLNKSY